MMMHHWEYTLIDSIFAQVRDYILLLVNSRHGWLIVVIEHFSTWSIDLLPEVIL